MSVFERVGENLVRHRGGAYYLQAKVGGKYHRFSLKTDKLRIAKIKRDAELARLRKELESQARQGKKVRTVGDALAILSDRMSGPHLKQSTRDDYAKIIAVLRRTMPLRAAGSEWTRELAEKWWRGIAGRYADQRANRTLLLARKAMEILIEHGARSHNPLDDVKRMRVKSAGRAMPSQADLERIIEFVRGQKRAHVQESANLIAFIAYSGCRKEEALAVKWEDVQGDWLMITGGATGTKNHRERRVPISPALRSVLDGMHYEGAAGPMWTIKSPRRALNTACDELGLPHMRIHDLRHFFATWAIERDVEIPTVAKWLGHQDGGALLMKTYGHLRDAHSLEQAKKLKR